MEKQPVYEEIKFGALTPVTVTQAVVEARLLPQPSEDIARVLSITAVSSVNGIEAFNGEARFNGRVDFKVLYADNNGKNRVLSCSMEFSDKTESDKIKPDTILWANSTVIDTDAVSLKSDEIKLASVVEISVLAVSKESVNYLSAGGEGVYTQEEKVEFSRFIASGKGVFTEECAIESAPFSAVLLAEHRVIITSASSERDLITVGGVIVSDITGETEDGLITAVRVETPFTEEVGANEVRSGDFIVTRASVSGENQLVEGEKGNKVIVSYALEVKFLAFASESKTVVTDAFLPTHELICERKKVEVERRKECVTVYERVEGSVTLKEGAPIVDSILATTGFTVAVSNAVAYEIEALIEGMVSGNILYYSAEENKKCSVSVELPFSIRLGVSALEQSDSINAYGCVNLVTTKIRRANEIDVRAEVVFKIDIVNKKESTFICGMERGKELTLPTSAISVHIVSHRETLWDVAKALGATPELIMKQNPNLVLPLSAGERIILFRHLDKN